MRPLFGPDVRGDPEFIRNILFAADLSLLLYFVLLVLVGLWALGGALPKDVRARYPKNVVYRSQLPFTEQWRTSVAAEDLPAFVTARRRGHVFALVQLLNTHLIAAFFYLHAIVDTWRCHTNAFFR